MQRSEGVAVWWFLGAFVGPLVLRLIAPGIRFWVGSLRQKCYQKFSWLVFRGNFFRVFHFVFSIPYSLYGLTVSRLPFQFDEYYVERLIAQVLR